MSVSVVLGHVSAKLANEVIEHAWHTSLLPCVCSTAALNMAVAGLILAPVLQRTLMLT